MSELPQLMALEPLLVEASEEEEIVTIIPSSEEKIYDKLWMTQLSIISKSPTKEAQLVAVLIPCRDTDGTKELMPDAENIILNVNDLFQRMATNQSLAISMGAVLNEVIAIGQEKGVIQ